jgi:hypothetical protein
LLKLFDRAEADVIFHVNLKSKSCKGKASASDYLSARPRCQRFFESGWASANKEALHASSRKGFL